MVVKWNTYGKKKTRDLAEFPSIAYSRHSGRYQNWKRWKTFKLERNVSRSIIVKWMTERKGQPMNHAFFPVTETRQELNATEQRRNYTGSRPGRNILERIQGTEIELYGNRET